MAELFQDYDRLSRGELAHYAERIRWLYLISAGAISVSCSSTAINGASGAAPALRPLFHSKIRFEYFRFLVLHPV
jgi:hypothetical protein